MDFERISANALFSSLVASTVFLLGFLLNGVLADFKESEKIPGELATALESLDLEVRAIPKYHPEANVDIAVFSIAALANDLFCWLREGLSTDQLLINYRKAHSDVVGAAIQFKGDASTLRGRLMQDLAVILQKVNRVRTIRDTTFVPLVYWMAEIASTLLFVGLVFTRTENLPESVFFLGVISFLLILLLRLINDIDNPFGQADINSAEDVSICLLEDIVVRLKVDLPPTSAS
jgi:predicted membrane chloride channel (bestrophin family)